MAKVKEEIESTEELVKEFAENQKNTNREIDCMDLKGSGIVKLRGKKL